jgi:ribosome-associated protein
MTDPIDVSSGVRIPASAITFRSVRSSGPGGQNVNKVASKVELRIDLDRIEGLDAGQRGRLLRLVSSRLAADGRLLVTSQRTRDREKNLEDARSRVGALVERALPEPIERRATRPTFSSRVRRVDDKKKVQAKKRSRQRPSRSGDE